MHLRLLQINNQSATSIETFKMPRYHSLNTGIGIAVWDPLRSSLTADSQVGDLSRPKTTSLHTQGPAAGHLVEHLKEECFDGHDGVHFLAGCMPFFLVRAGQDLFERQQPNHLQDSPQNPRTSGPNTDADLANLLSSTAKNGIAASDTPIADPDDDSSLSSVSSSRFDSPVVAIDATSKSSTPAISKPISTAKPIQIAIDLSQKSFMPSIFTGAKQEYVNVSRFMIQSNWTICTIVSNIIDKGNRLCINIFFNGELTHSRIVKQASLAPSYDSERYQHYSGRRIGTYLEVPWVIVPSSSSAATQNGKSGCGTLESRWNEINQMLLTEAEEWGHYGRSRSVMGEYLVRRISTS
jgi:hypothetical protein